MSSANSIGSGLLPMDPQTFKIDSSVEALGTRLAETYRQGQPYPNACLDDFLPAQVAAAMLDAFPGEVANVASSFDRPQERLKRSFLPETMGNLPRQVFYAFNSLPFIRFLETMTGIPGLIPDPHFLGGGFHEVLNGGHLDIHADFNLHGLLGLERRINVLIYLNRDWRAEYGGQFEMWDVGMKQRVHAIDPAFNRCVIFNTTSTSYHGNPNPVRHPQGTSRKSIALYYYTATWQPRRTRAHTTQFKKRPGSRDIYDYAIRAREIAADVLPPVLYRAWLRLYQRLQR